MRTRELSRNAIRAAAMFAAMFAAERLSAAVIEPDSTAHHGAHITFVDESHDFGDIDRRGGDAEWRFEFVNDGDEPLIITQLKTSCTCLRYKYPRRPVAPGQQGAVEVSFQPHKTEPGTFHRVVTVLSNATNGARRLVMQGKSSDNRHKR